jgi:hypothetical protein
MTDRAYWISIATKLATPVLEALAARELRKRMPVECRPGHADDRARYTHVEALGRLLCGTAPWLELGPGSDDEGRLRAKFAALAREAIDAGTDPASPDLMNFASGLQPIVDASFLSQAILRAPTQLWEMLDARVRRNVVTRLRRPAPASRGSTTGCCSPRRLRWRSSTPAITIASWSKPSLDAT